MQSAMIQSGRRAAVCSRAGSRSSAPVRRPLAVRAEVNQGDKPTTSAPLQGLPTDAPVASTSGFQLLGVTQEAINGRSAMLGFVAAIVAESLTHQAVWSQIAGKYVDMDLVEKPLGLATLGFGSVVALVTMATLVPKFVDNLEVDSRSFGPFTPDLEKKVGRVAQLGFLGLVLLELAKGSSLL